MNNFKVIKNNAGKYELYSPSGKLVKTYISKNDLNTYCTDLGFKYTETSSLDSDIQKVNFDINKRFGFLVQFTNMVIENKVPSLLLVGGPGLGKSYMVNQVLEQANLSEETDYMVIKGHSSARALFNTLRDNNGKTIIFDDCDSIFKDTSALNILKGALDSYSKRIISWNTAEEPETVEFTGRIIFISNLSLDRIESAILSRSFVVDLDVTKDEMLLRMEEILENVEPRVELSLKQEALELIKANKDVISELNMRSLIKAIRIRNSGVANWEDLLVYSLFN